MNSSILQQVNDINENGFYWRREAGGQVCGGGGKCCQTVKNKKGI